MSRRVVITGMGIWSCIGTYVDEVSMALRTGRSGIGIDTNRTLLGFHSPLTGIVARPALQSFLDKRTRHSLAQQSEYAYMSTREALSVAKIDEDYLENNEVGIIFGNDSSGQAVVEAHKCMEEVKDTYLLGSSAVFKSMNSTVTMSLSTIFHLRGVNLTVSAACSSGSHAVGLAYMYIKQGFQDIIICGGAQEVNAISTASFDGLDTFSKHITEPQKASRPFDKDRDGLIPSGGGATLILEEYEHAIARGATIWGEITGYGFSSSGELISQSNVSSCVIAMERAIQSAHIETTDIDYINAHATSTIVGDNIEAKALTQLFGKTNAVISSTKSMTGHECWMSGASEIIYTLLMIRDGFIAPNINLETVDPIASHLNIATTTVKKNINIALSNSFGFGGTNSAIIVKRM